MFLNKAIAASNGIHWTYHVQDKMRFYRLSEARVKRVLHSPKRVEEGVAPNTVASMQPTFIKTKDGKQAWTQEIWVMTQKVRQSAKGKGHIVKIISAWRYPGMSKVRSAALQNVMRQEYGSFITAGK